MTETTTKPAPVEKEWVYIGKRLSRDDSRLYYAMLDEHDKEGYYKKPITGTTVGGRYIVRVTETDDSTTVQLKTYRYVGLHENASKVAGWVAEQAAHVAEYEARLVEKKDGRGQLAALRLSDVAARYRRLPPNRARGLLAAAISIITTSRGGE